MSIDRRTMLLGAVGLAAASTVRAQQWGDPPTPAASSPDRPAWPPREHFRLWPGRAPGALATLPVPNDTMNGPAANRELWLRGVADPIVAVYRPAKPDGRALLSIPGGGYRFVSVQNEGIDVARTFTPQGITVFVLAYRLPAEGWANQADVPLQDAQRAMRLIRARAGTWGIDPDKLGICGFSAGGHLAAVLSVGHDDRVYAPIDAADRLSARPAFSGLVYPVVSVDPARGGSGMALIGDDATAEQRARHDADRRVTAETPPLFIAHALDDPVVDVRNPLNMLAAARAAKVPVEAHLFESGGHGFGPMHLADEMPGSRWPALFELWMGRHVGARG